MAGVCETQESFNKAVKTAVNHLDDDGNKNQAAKIIITLIMLTFYFWALLLAMKADEKHRVLHVLFALCTGPLYVLSYYLGMMKAE